VVLGSIDGPLSSDREGVVVVAREVDVVEIATVTATDEVSPPSERTVVAHAVAPHSSPVAAIQPSDRALCARLTRPHRPFEVPFSHRLAWSGSRV
jgi:hypothetical protein